MAELIAIRCDPDQAGSALRSVWSEGDAALLLPRDDPEAVVAGILAAQRPAALIDLPGGGTGAVRHARPGGLRTPLPRSIPVADDVALVVTTSGSTGRPKGVELTHAALRASTSASLDRLGCRAGERWALALPTHHVAGVQVLLRSDALETEAIVVADLQELPTCGAEHVSLVPTQLARLLETGADVSRFRTILLGGGRPAPDLLERARTAGADVVVSYGMSETCGGCVYDGRPLGEVEVDVVADRIRIRGPVLFRGYRGEPQRSALDEDGWFVTGDLGRFVDGRLEILGRADDVIVTGGENVPVPAVEAALRRVPGIADVAVTSRADAEWGQLVVAVVVADDPARPPLLEDLRAHVRGHHAAAWAPRKLVVVPALPRDPMGKVSRTVLDGYVDDVAPPVR